MKKRMLFALGIVITTACLSLTSCGDDDDDEPSRTTCTCKEYDGDTNKLVTTKNDIDANSYSVSSCSELEEKLDAVMNGEFYYDCY